MGNSNASGNSSGKSKELRKLAESGNEKRKVGSTDFESEAMGLKDEIIQAEKAIRLLNVTDVIENELTRAKTPNVYVDYFSKRRSQRQTSAELVSSLQSGLKAFRTRVKNMEAKLANAAPDESKWFATYPTVMKLINWRRGHVEGNIMPHVGELEEERSIKELEGVQEPKVRMTKVWIYILKKFAKAAKQMDQYFKDGILRRPDGTLMNVKPDVEARIHEALASTGRSKMVENCKMIDQATAQMMERGELLEDAEELLSLLREIQEWCKMTLIDIPTQQEATLVPSVSSKSATADTEKKDLCSPVAADVPALSPAVPPIPSKSQVSSLCVDDVGENSLSMDFPVVEALLADVSDLETLLPIAPCGPIISRSTASKETEVEENEGKEGPVAC